MFPFDYCEPTDPGTDKYAGTLGDFRTDSQTRLLHGTLGGRNRVVNKKVHLLDVLFVKLAERIELFDLSGDPGGKLGGIKTSDFRDAAASFA